MLALILFAMSASLTAQAAVNQPVPMLLPATQDSAKSGSDMERVHNLLTLATDRLKVADRTSAYLEQASSEIEAHTKEVGGMWFRSWRTSGVVERYLATANRLEEMAKYAALENLKPVAKMLNDTASDFRSIAQSASLGGSETVNDGTGVYTSQIATSISTIHSRLNLARQTSSMRLTEVSVEVDNLKAKLERLTATN